MVGEMPANVEDLDLRRSTLTVEQKRIFLNLRENVRGRYLRIAEGKLALGLALFGLTVGVSSPSCTCTSPRAESDIGACVGAVTGNNRSTIIIPSSGLLNFRKLLDEFIENDSAVAMGQQVMLGEADYGLGKQKKKRGKKPADGQNGEAGEGASENDDKRVFVGNLAWSTNQQGLKDHFSQCGEIAQADVFTERSGRSRGCGIVEFTSAEMAKNAMIAMNNTELDGRMIFVREDRG
jgi:hypothetical protein